MLKPTPAQSATLEIMSWASYVVDLMYYVFRNATNNLQNISDQANTVNLISMKRLLA